MRCVMTTREGSRPRPRVVCRRLRLIVSTKMSEAASPCRPRPLGLSMEGTSYPPRVVSDSLSALQLPRRSPERHASSDSVMRHRGMPPPWTPVISDTLSYYLSVLSGRTGMGVWFTKGVTGTRDAGAAATEAVLTDLNRRVAP